ncbi:hypothetical protein BACCAP_04869 [Pseudoflavonifractor capillosus ATCC 29799]|uniref:Uncharacterized protein n=1 Tax=Pseudoflavonifractor capillosus ATCC 29799 TaxID=411467 RepID=A6P2Y4_9FIRM|nr:hypothetical protein BACCAP_04869 [Pseudoflavonifractor capillosus ATCC 29799]
MCPLLMPFPFGNFLLPYCNLSVSKLQEFSLSFPVALRKSAEKCPYRSSTGTFCLCYFCYWALMV